MDGIISTFTDAILALSIAVVCVPLFAMMVTMSVAINIKKDPVNVDFGVRTCVWQDFNDLHHKSKTKLSMNLHLLLWLQNKASGNGNHLHWTVNWENLH